MQEIIRMAEKLNESMPEWRSWYINNQYKKDDCNKEEKTMLFDMIELVRKKEKQLIDRPDKEEERKWGECIENHIKEDVYKKMRESLDTVLSIYRDMKVIRDMKEGAVPFLADAIYYYSAFYDDSFLEKNEQYGIEDKEVFEKAVSALDTVVYAHADKHFTKQMAKREFEDVTGIMEPYSNCYAELYEKYFDTIQGNCCIELLRKLNGKLNYLIRKLDDD